MDRKCEKNQVAKFTKNDAKPMKIREITYDLGKRDLPSKPNFRKWIFFCQKEVVFTALSEVAKSKRSFVGKRILTVFC